MSVFNKFTIGTAVGKKTKIDLSHDHLTTSEFGIFKPILCHEMIPGDSFNVDLSSFCRFAPLYAPTFGSCQIVNRAFFVPFRSITPVFDDLISGNLHTAGSSTFYVNNVPTVTNKVLFDVLNTNSEEVTSTVCDYTYNNKKWNLTSLGRKIYDLLLCLGYGINFTVNDSTAMSALPLLAYLRVWYDYICPSNYRAEFAPYESLFKIDSANPTLSYSDVSAITNFIVGCYNPDFFTSQFKFPNGVVADNATSFSVYGSDDLSVVHTRNQDAINYGGESSYSASHDTLNVLESVHHFFRRNFYGGLRVIEQLKSRFGISVDPIDYSMSVYLGSQSQSVQVADVTSQSDTFNSSSGDGARLGEQGGKAISYGSGRFSYDSKMFGMFIILSGVLPRSGYYQGRDSQLFHIDRFSFFTPEFENMGMEATRNDALFAAFTSTDDYQAGLNYGGRPNAIFGYVPRYSNYKYKKDTISGSFRMNSINTGLDSYHFERMIYVPSSTNPLALNLNFVTYKDSYKYNRIFQYMGNANTNVPDHLTLYYHFDFTAYRPMKSITDKFDETEGHDAISVNPEGVI